MFDENEIKKIIRQILDEGHYPENLTYDDAGLDVENYKDIFFMILEKADPELSWKT